MSCYLHIDESGDLGLKLNSKQRRSSNYFVLLGLLIKTQDAKKLTFAVKKTIKRKLNVKKNQVFELKGNQTNFKLKLYFWNQVKNIDFELFGVILDKKHLKTRLPWLSHQHKKILIYKRQICLFGEYSVFMS